MTRRLRRSATGSASLGQLVVGLVALPLSAVPFLAYGAFTPEGRLVRDRLLVAIRPPQLPTVTAAQREAAVAAAPTYENGVVAVAYHGIGSASDAEGGFVVSPERFAEHLAYLRAAGMHAVTARDVALAFDGGPPLPPNAVMLSFDDGRTDAMLFADGLLEQAGMRATMFVISKAASRPGVYYASWDKIEGYSRSGRWDIQSHTAASHTDHRAAGGERLPLLTSLAPGESLDEYRLRVREDLSQASSSIEAHVGVKPVAFAYPFGAYGADRTNDIAIQGILREEVARRYTVAFHQDDQGTIPLLTAANDRLGLRRLEVGNWSGLTLLRQLGRAAAGGGPAAAAPDPVVPAIDFPPLPEGSVSVELPANNRVSSPPTPNRAAPAATAAATATATSSPTSAVTTPAAPATTAPPATSPPITVAPPVTAPPTTAPRATTPPTTSAPVTTPPTTAACPLAASGKGPKTCPPGQSG